MLPALTRYLFPSGARALALLGWLTCSFALAQFPDGPSEPWRAYEPSPIFERCRPSACPAETELPAVPHRPRFFRMPLDLGGDPPAGEGASDGRLQVQVGSDNPFLDIRRPGDPGGVGYQTLTTQLQVFDNGTTGVVVGLWAVRPSGPEFDGASDGPTVIRPALGLVQGLGDGTALHGFVGKELRPGPQWDDGLDRNLQYGMAVQTPLPGAVRNPGQGLYLFVEALGRYRYEGDGKGAPPAAWEVVPGLHWRNADNWWMSSGVLVPVGTGRAEGGMLQITCGMNF
ncbi:MAG TPA: hypothetical protein VNK04_15850 [Gemmataceae bacterium]|nr:hypothetical protein [Gemmataceae bacterium]